ncbi:MAG: OsmC family peroxiredoxin [Candidatus Thermofonsia Clade 1 bacterium]|jgi:osmotically inducible protein OsmC|uniref:OsmC family peroxiredoxin n=1 Tax=Candidatus Thermofonsia Clade 1 bacterium TaxID=2364210 RepID=A0A2M8PZK2_9CHLR|nr:MAG: OsmC family peroxiredoxin [Candidatus Thermofonsia Clade 1 bacterium]PJF42970.1 MAG: OsmC family peroxiredoxin [Candidatus Thermofonsia Clade 1 bacterium]RMF53705.1 MAG: OsmC family peroxiredoxin [Chloroflexota bacterium]
MSDIERSATATWHGTLREGTGHLSTQSGTLNNTPYTFVTRFEQAPGTNPEELIAAAEAGCFTMNIAAVLGRHEIQNVRVTTTAVCVLSQVEGGRKITKIKLITRAKGDGLSLETFQKVAEDAMKNCIISRALGGVDEFELDAALEA